MWKRWRRHARAPGRLETRSRGTTPRARTWSSTARSRRLHEAGGQQRERRRASEHRRPVTRGERLERPRMRPGVEVSVRSGIALVDRLEQVPLARRVDRLVRLLAVHPRPREVAVAEPGREPLAEDRVDRRAAAPDLAP